MMTRAVYHENGPVAIRYPRGGEGAWRGDTRRSRSPVSGRLSVMRSRSLRTAL